MRTALSDLTVLPPKLPNTNDQRKSSEHGKCTLPIFLAQYQPQALSRKSVVQCVYSVILVHFSCLKPCICLATAGAFYKDFNSSAMYKEPLPFVCVELTTHPLHLLSLFVPNTRNACATQAFRVFSFTLSTHSSLNQRVLVCILTLDVGGHSLPLIVSVALLWLSNSAVSS